MRKIEDWLDGQSERLPNRSALVVAGIVVLLLVSITALFDEPGPSKVALHASERTAASAAGDVDAASMSVAAPSYNNEFTTP
ncbi:MAG TPA: hypothetical protein VGB97_02425 [Candidatus Paceibacterota bacterium]|jgi:hypothetical protein